MAGKTLQSTIEIAGTLSPSLQQAIKQAVDRLEEMSQETLESAGAAAKLAAEISTQESVLKNLQRGYEDYIVSGSESTDEALKLASTIQDLSGELNENRTLSKQPTKQPRNSRPVKEKRPTHIADCKSRSANRKRNLKHCAAPMPT